MNTLLTPDVLTLFDALDDRVRLVGGCVRDYLMRLPVDDIDLATPLLPAIVINKLQQCGIRVVPTGLSHGTVTAILNHKPYEITTLRTDDETDGRHAAVSFTDSYEQDSCRRDFTINALYMDRAGVIYDYTNGQRDIKNRIVRFIGNPYDRVQEDYLRILRYFRFWGKMKNPAVDKASLNACKKYAAGLKHISKERKRDELLKILAQPMPMPALILMQETGVLSYVLPDADLPALLRFLQVSPKADMLERLSILVGENVPDLAFSRIQKRVLTLMGQPVVLGDLQVDDQLCLSAVGKEIFDFYITRALADKTLTPAVADSLYHLRVPPFKIKGSDLLAAGFKKGPQIKENLEKAKIIWAQMGFPDNKKLVIERLIKYNVS